MYFVFVFQLVCNAIFNFLKYDPSRKSSHKLHHLKYACYLQLNGILFLKVMYLTWSCGWKWKGSKCS